MLTDTRLAEKLAGAQGGVLTRQQAHECGVSSKVIRRKLTTGNWHLRFGVLDLGTAPHGPDWRDAWALGLRFGPSILVTGPTALRLSHWPVACPKVLACCPPSRHSRVESVRLIRDSQQRRWRQGPAFRLVTRQLALIDALQYLPLSEAREILDLALQRHWIDTRTWNELIAPRLGVGRVGARQLRGLSRRVTEGTHSDAERLLLRLLRSDGQKNWVCNYPLRGSDGTIEAELDFALPELRLCLEVDGRAFHSDHASFEIDRIRQNRVMLQGWLVLRFTWSQLTMHPEQVLAEVRRAVAIRQRLRE